MTVRLGPLDPSAAGEVLTLQRAAYVTEARHYGDLDLPPLVQTLDDLRDELAQADVVGLGAWDGDRLVGSVRVRVADDVGHLGRLVVAPDRQGQGIGTALLQAAEAALPEGVREMRLFTGERSVDNLRLYERMGYVRSHETSAGTYALVHLAKRIRP